MALTQAQLADIERAKAMVAQSQAEGSKPFKGSSFDKPDAPWNQATPNISGGLETKPIDNTGGGNLTAFKDTLGQVMNLARQARNSNMQGFMNTPGFQGTLAASDFNTLFNQMNTMGDQYGEMQAEKIVGETTPQWKTDQIGSDVYQYQIGADGKMIGEPVKVLSGENSSNSKEEQKQQEYSFAEKYVSENANTMSRDELRNSILRDSEHLTATEVDAILNANYKKRYIDETWFKDQYENYDDLEKAAYDAGDREGGFLGFGVGPTGVQNYISSFMKKVEELRNKGYSDDQIEKELF